MVYQSVIDTPILAQPQESSNLPFPLVDSPFFETELRNNKLTASQIELVRSFRKDGYLIINDRVVDEIMARRITSDVEEKIDKKSGRLQDAWREFPSVRELATHETILSLLRMLYGREAVPFQTLNFNKGTEQATHSDAIHFSTLPRGFMCGVWVALEDITISQGPLHYFPGSHMLPEYDYYDLGIADEIRLPNEPADSQPGWDSPRTKERYKLYEIAVAKIMEEQGFQRQALALKQGEYLLWAANLFHGGNPIIAPGSTRKSQVTHYHFEGVIPWTPHFSNARIGQYHIPPLVDIRTLKPMERSYNFMPVDFIPTSVKDRYTLRLNPTGKNQSADAVPVYEELEKAKAETEYFRQEAARLQRDINAIPNSRMWQMMRKLSKGLSGR